MAGCFSGKPPENVDFAVVKSIDEFNGVYGNRGRREADPKIEDMGRKPYHLCLSMFLWPDEKWETHKAIQRIEIKSLDADTLSIKGIGESGVLKEGLFVKGKDFELSSTGRIVLPWRMGVPLPIVGIGAKQVELGLDLRGDGKYKEHLSVAGLFALLIPIAATGTEEARFERLAGE